MLSTHLATALRSGRADFNSRFLEARRLFPNLDGDVFSEFLGSEVSSLIDAVAERNLDVVPRVVSTTYDVALELIGQNLVGSSARLPWQNSLWRDFPTLASWVVSSPDLVIPSLCNAIHNLSLSGDSRPQNWLDDLKRLSPLCTSVEEFLRCGQISAWRAGLPQYRKGAMELLKNLPKDLALASLEVDDGSPIEHVLEKLSNDPWYDPRNVAGGDNSWKVGIKAGAFRGFGGIFVEPPLITIVNDEFLVTSAGQSWVLVADCFGASFLRNQSENPRRLSYSIEMPSGISGSEKTISREGVHIDIADLGRITSVASNNHTLALTAQLSHAVHLIPCS